MHKACGGLQQFAVPHGVQVCATTRDLAVAATLRLRWFPHPRDTGEIAPTVFQLTRMQWLMDVTDKMDHPCQGHSSLLQQSAAISQYSTLSQEGFNGA